MLVHTGTKALEGLSVERVRCDIRDALGVSDAVAGAEVAYHLAGSIGVGQVPAEHVRTTNLPSPVVARDADGHGGLAEGPRAARVRLSATAGA